MSHPPVECRVGFLATNINSWVPQPTLSSQLEDLATNILTPILNILGICVATNMTITITILSMMKKRQILNIVWAAALRERDTDRLSSSSLFWKHVSCSNLYPEQLGLE